MRCISDPCSHMLILQHDHLGGSMKLFAIVSLLISVASFAFDSNNALPNGTYKGTGELKVVDGESVNSPLLWTTRLVKYHLAKESNAIGIKCKGTVDLNKEIIFTKIQHAFLK